ncbi:MAG TPA: hypothetical protein VNT75_24165 [Symbiobacteriaceae bacterium]|nr:hypothetical protein [Symbiobacteriaceae bacterium]
MFVRKMGKWAMVAIVLGLLWFLLNDVLVGASQEAALSADLVIDGQTYADKAAFFGPWGTGNGVSVAALVTALGGTLEPAAPADGAPVLVTLGGKRLLFYHGPAPQTVPEGALVVNEITRRTAPALGWYWTTGEVKDYLKLVYPAVTVATAFDREQRSGRGIFVETKPRE